MDLQKLANLNARHMADLPFERFCERAWDWIAELPWAAQADGQPFREVAALMQSRTKTFAMVRAWDYFFTDDFAVDGQAVRKFLGSEDTLRALADLRARLDELDVWDEEAIEAAVHACTEAHGIKRGKLNQPLRVLVSGQTTGAGIYETVALLGREATLRRLPRPPQVREITPEVRRALRRLLQQPQVKRSSLACRIGVGAITIGRWLQDDARRIQARPWALLEIQLRPFLETQPARHEGPPLHASVARRFARADRARQRAVLQVILGDPELPEAVAEELRRHIFGEDLHDDGPQQAEA